MRTALIVRGGALLIAVAAAYSYLAPAHIVGGDNPELATFGAVGGVAHPSGYPLYVLWLRALAWLPAGSPAHVTALATAILAVASVAMLHAAARAWGARPVGATIAVAIYAAAPMVVRLSTEAEVFALNNLVVATVLWLAAAAGPLRGWQRALALGVVAGLGLANHMTCVLVAPVGLVGLVRGVREARVRAAAIGLAVAGLAAGLVPYVYVLVAPRGDASWGDVRTLGDVVDLFLRRDYGGPTGLAAGRADVPALASIAALVASIARAWWYAPAIVGVGVLGWRAARERPDGEPRAGWCALAASFVLAGPVLVSRFNLPPDGLFLSIVQRFHVLPALLLAIPIAVGLERVVAKLRDGVGAAVGVAVFAVALAADLPRLAVQHSAIVEDGVHNMLLALPPDTVLLIAPDDLVTGTRYAQLALGERPDVHVVAWPLMTLPWYAARQAAAGIVPVDGDRPLRVRLAEAILARGRPLVVDALAPDVLAALPHYPIGGMFRVLPRGAALPALDDVVAQNRELFLHRFALAPTPTAEDDWSAEVYVRYARTWAEIGQMFERAGRGEDAGHAYGMAAQLHPGE